MPHDFLKELRAESHRRDIEWRWKCGDAWPLPTLFRATELGGEVGELLNVVKKLERERLGWGGKRDTLEHLREEIGDVLVCLDLLAMEYGVDVEEAAREAFNKVSERIGLSQRLPAAPTATGGLANQEQMRAALTAAIGAGGQAVAGDIETQAWECDRWPGWLHAIVERTNDVADRLDMSSEQAHAYAVLFALSQPQPADERVVEALRKIEYALTKDSLCEAEKIDDALYMVRLLISAKEGRENG